MIFIESKKKSEKTLKKSYPNALIIDVTSKGNEPYLKFSPFYPHGNIPIPNSNGFFSETVEGVWQGLKVFENHDIDQTKFQIKNMSGIKRTVRKFGKPLGHRYGINSNLLLDYISARKKIYMTTYAYILQNRLKEVVDDLIKIAFTRDLILLDYDTNEDIENSKKPLSHASLIKKHLEYKFPELKTLKFEQLNTEKDKVKNSRKTKIIKEKVTENKQIKLF